MAASLDPALTALLRLALAGLFAAAALHKLRDPGGFLATLADYRLLPGRALAPAFAALASAELAVAVGLLVPALALPAALGGAALLALYAGAIAVNLLRGRRHIDCGCLGFGARRTLSEGLLARNAALVLACGLAALPPAPRALTALDAATVAGGALALALLALAARTLAEGAVHTPHAGGDEDREVKKSRNVPALGAVPGPGGGS